MKPVGSSITAVSASAALSIVMAACIVPTAAYATPNPSDSTMAGDTQGNYVAFGDSFAANPGFNDEPNGTATMAAGGCETSTVNIGHKVAEKTDLSLREYVCNGSVVYMPEDDARKRLLDQVDSAIANRDLDENTELVTVLIGANDAVRMSWTPADQQNTESAANVGTALDGIRTHAPNAEILVVGYPEITSPDGSHYFCPINAFGFAPQVPASVVHQGEYALDERQRRAAADNGATFANLKEVGGIDTGMCGPDGERLMAAYLDTDIDRYNQTSHPTFDGSEVYATEIARVYSETRSN